MPDWKQLAWIAGISLGVAILAHQGVLNFIPGLSGPSKQG